MAIIVEKCTCKKKNILKDVFIITYPFSYIIVPILLCPKKPVPLISNNMGVDGFALNLTN
jgi:hypothetical protein